MGGVGDRGSGVGVRRGRQIPQNPTAAVDLRCLATVAFRILKGVGVHGNPGFGVQDLAVSRNTGVPTPDSRSPTPDPRLPIPDSRIPNPDPRTMQHLAIALIVVAVLSVADRLAVADVFVLAGGGRVTGELENKDESPRERFIIRTASGGRLTLEASQVKRVIQPRAEESEYEAIRPGYPDTVEGQWALAEWCRQRRLTPQRTTHLNRIIELDPDHAAARRALGYHQTGGRWVTRKQLMAERGYIYHKGRYRTPQEIEILEQRRKTDVAEKEWYGKLKRWRGWLGGEKDGRGRAEILGINDPHAIEALTRALRDDPVAGNRQLYVEALARVGTPDAVMALAKTSIADPVADVRLTCLDHIEQVKRPDVTAYYVGKLRDKNNDVVNLAAVGLRRVKDPSAVGPLIDALVTTHKFKVGKPGGPGGMTTTFGTGPGGSGAPGGGGLSMGGGPKIYAVSMRNQAVLDALVAITRQNFSFDQQAWKYWLASQRPKPEVDVRRD